MKKFIQLSLMTMMLFAHSMQITSDDNGMDENQQRAQNLFIQSLITPAQEYAIFNLFNQPFIVNKNTGQARFFTPEGQLVAMPNVQQIIEQATSGNASKVQAEKALIATIEALKVAIVTAALDFAYAPENQNYYLWQARETQVTGILNEQKIATEQALVQIKTLKNTPAQKIDASSWTIADGYTLLTDIEKIVAQENNDFLKKRNGKLLFQQCLVAQTVSEESSALGKILFDSPLVINNNYNYKSLPSVENLMARLKQDHETLIHIHEASMIALYIGKEKSTARWLTSDPLQTELQNIETEIRKKCIAAGIPDNRINVNNQKMWELMDSAMWWGTRVGGAAAIGGTAYYIYNNPKTLEKMKDSLINSTITTKDAAVKTVADTTKAAQQKVYDNTQFLRPDENRPFYEKAWDATKSAANSSLESFKNSVASDGANTNRNIRSYDFGNVDAENYSMSGYSDNDVADPKPTAVGLGSAAKNTWQNIFTTPTQPVLALPAPKPVLALPAPK